MCGRQQYNEFGRAMDNYPCNECPGSEVAPFLGSTDCLSAAEVEAKTERQILKKLILKQTGRIGYDHFIGTTQTSLCVNGKELDAPHARTRQWNQFILKRIVYRGNCQQRFSSCGF